MSGHRASVPASPALLAVAVLLAASAVWAASAAPSSADAGGAGAARVARARANVGAANAIGGVGPRLRRYPMMDAMLDDEDEALFEANKRQMSDDYGHMRFGKRGGGDNDFAEYGHMRFGRAAEAA